MLKLCQVFLDCCKSSHLLEGLGYIFFAKEKEKMQIISKTLVSLELIFNPKSHIFHFTYKYFLKGISHIPKTSEKTRFLCQNDPKNTKSQQIETFLHVIDDKKLQVFENPYRETPKGILYVQKKNRKN